MLLRVCSKTLRSFALTALVALGTTACAGLMAQQAHVEAETQAYVFDEDPDAVVAAARDLLFTAGYTVTDSGPNSLETAWKLSDDGDDRSRRLVQITESSEGTTLTAKISRQSLDTDGTWSGPPPHRDAWFELEVIERLDADEARRIRAGADQAKQDAREQ